MIAGMAAAHVPTLRALRKALAQLGSPERAQVSRRFFKTGEGDYGEGDQFIGVPVPAQRAVARTFAKLSLEETLELLRSPVHEERLTALFILVSHYQRGKDEMRAEVVKAYLANTRFVNNWDLVDSSAPQILGHWLLDKDRRVLVRLARSKLLWERRIAMLATQAFINNGQSADALKIAELLLGDSHDLIHKAVGWMLREIGKRIDVQILREFLSNHASSMPRTALRYAIEHLPPAERKRWLSRAAK